MHQNNDKYDLFINTVPHLTIYDATISSRERERAQQEIKKLLHESTLNKNPVVKMEVKTKCNLDDFFKSPVINERDESLRLAVMRRRSCLVEKSGLRKMIYDQFKQFGLLSAREVSFFGHEWSSTN